MIGYTPLKTVIGLVVAAALAVDPTPAAATADGPDFFQVTGVAATDTLNIREAPDPHATKIGENPPNGT